LAAEVKGALVLVQLCNLARQFWTRTRGAVTVEFVVSLPLLIAVLAFSTQYGRAIQARNTLDVAVRDAARLLSRAPVADAATDFQSVPGTVPEVFITSARQLVTDRVAGLMEEVTFTEIRSDATGSVVEVEAVLEFPFLSAFSFGEADFSEITLVTREAWPRL
jgi:Flp pilus assembly protein TadG